MPGSSIGEDDEENVDDKEKGENEVVKDSQRVRGLVEKSIQPGLKLLRSSEKGSGDRTNAFTRFTPISASLGTSIDGRVSMITGRRSTMITSR